MTIVASVRTEVYSTLGNPHFYSCPRRCVTRPCHGRRPPLCWGGGATGFVSAAGGQWKAGGAVGRCSQGQDISLLHWYAATVANTQAAWSASGHTSPRSSSVTDSCADLRKVWLGGCFGCPRHIRRGLSLASTGLRCFFSGPVQPATPLQNTLQGRPPSLPTRTKIGKASGASTHRRPHPCRCQDSSPKVDFARPSSRDVGHTGGGPTSLLGPPAQPGPPSRRMSSACD